MSRLTLNGKVNQIKQNILSLLSSVFGVNINQAPLEVNEVFQKSKDLIQYAEDLKNQIDPEINDFIKSLNIPEGLEGLDNQSVLSILKNPKFDLKVLQPILNNQINNTDIQKVVNTGLPGTGAIVGQLGNTLSHITKTAQLLPDFVKEFLTTNANYTLAGPDTVINIIDPSFAKLDQLLRRTAADPLFKTQPNDILLFIGSTEQLPLELNEGLYQNKEDPSAFLTQYIENTDLSSLSPLVYNPLLGGSFLLLSVDQIEFLTQAIPNLTGSIRADLALGNFSTGIEDLYDFITEKKLNKLTTKNIMDIQQVVSKTPAGQQNLDTVSQIISEGLELTPLYQQASKLGLANIDLEKLGYGNFNLNQLQNLFESDLDLGKLSKQINKLNLSQFDNISVSNLLKNGQQAALSQVGKLLNLGSSNLSGIVNLISSNKLGTSLSEIKDNLDKLAASYLGQDLLSYLNYNGNVNEIVNQIIQILPVGNQNLQNLLDRIGPVINTRTQATLLQKGTLLDESNQLVQKFQIEDFTSRGPEARNRDQRPRGTNEQYIPKANPTDYPEDGSLTH